MRVGLGIKNSLNSDAEMGIYSVSSESQASATLGYQLHTHKVQVGEKRRYGASAKDRQLCPGGELMTVEQRSSADHPVMDAETELRAGALGLPEVLMRGLAHMAPATALLFPIRCTTSQPGIGTRLAYVVAFPIVLSGGRNMELSAEIYRTLVVHGRPTCQSP